MKPIKITNIKQIVPNITIRNISTGTEVFIDEGFSGQETIKNLISNFECYNEELEIVINSKENSGIIGIFVK